MPANPSPSPPRENPERRRCEVAVVGSGPGGAIVACLLAEAGRDVVLVEEGPHVAQEACPNYSIEEMELKYRNGGLTLALGGPKIQYVEGRCVGGGSEINSGLYHRTPGPILEEWGREFQVEAISEREMEPHFEACERDLCVGLRPGPGPAASQKLGEGADRLGWKSLDVPRWFSYEPGGNGAKPPEGRRQTMSRTYIPRALAAGCALAPETRILGLRREGGRWALRGESRAAGGKARACRIEAESVFVCGGAIQTPLLLRRSGVKEGVGNHLRLHPMMKVVAQFGERVNDADMGVPERQIKEFAPRMSFGCSISSPPYLALGLGDHPGAAPRVEEAWDRMAVYYAATASSGLGSIRCVPGFRDPLVRYRLTPGDLKDLAEALRKLCEALFAAGARALYPALGGGPVLRGPDDLAKLPGTLPRDRTNLMTVHLFSSCPMGERRGMCAADSFGAVHGQPGLHIADASLLCSPPGVNPQGSVMAIARRNALKFLGKL